jgi:hypothetical protein
MNLNNQQFKLAVVMVSLVLSGCFPSKKVTLLKREGIANVTHITAPTKAFLLDASCILFQGGFSVKNDTVFGRGRRYWVGRADEQVLPRVIPLDSVAAMTYYEFNSSGGNKFASFLLGLFGATMTPLSIYCISCPKCCFGSCPTIYTHDGQNYQLEAEMFSYSISKFFQDKDLDRLAQKIPRDGRYPIRVSNEALETHYINQLSLLKVSHPLGTQVFPSNDGGFISTRNLQPPAAAVNCLGENVLPLVRNPDDRWYRGDTTMVKRLAEGVYSDWLDLKLNVPENAANVKLVLRLRNTLMNTVLFYDVVLASQGLDALEWTERMNTDQQYAAQFYAAYLSYAGITAKIYRNGAWVQQARIGDAGPITWRNTAVEIPLDANHEGELLLRLQFFPDNLMIDYVAFDVDTSAEETLLVEKVLPAEIHDNLGEARDEILPLIQHDDAQFLITNPGESYHFVYDLAPKAKMETTIFLQSKGYYTEWIRGEWLTTSPSNYRFNLFEIDNTISQLRQSWLENRELMEKEFFKTRIPLAEDL